jgi:hypothetical protein
VEIIPTFVGFRTSDRQSFEAGFERAERLAEDLKAAGCDIVVVSGTPPVLLKGLDFEREWRDRLSQKIGVPVISQMEPHAQALVAMGIRRVAIATYYGDELNQAIVNYFRRFDIEGIVLGGFQSTRAAGQALYTTSLKALDDVSYIEVYQYCKRGVRNLELGRGAGGDSARSRPAHQGGVRPGRGDLAPVSHVGHSRIDPLPRRAPEQLGAAEQPLLGAHQRGDGLVHRRGDTDFSAHARNRAVDDVDLRLAFCHQIQKHGGTCLRDL